MTTRTALRVLVGAAAVLSCAAAGFAQAKATEAVIAEASAYRIDFQAQVDHDGVVLTVSGPDNAYARRSFAPGEAISMPTEIDGKPLPDGHYAWEVVATPRLSAEIRAAMAQAREQGDETLESDLRAAGYLPPTPAHSSGFFRIQDGAIVADLEPERTAAGDRVKVRQEADGPVKVASEQLITGDLSVHNALCVGIDCAAQESYGADSIRLKENNLRIHFDDTSNSASFPNRDWRLIANDQANGGRNIFYLEDSTGGTQVLSVEAGAGNNALYVDDGGRVGFGTSAPVLDLHVATGNTPALRLEQNNSSGFSAQTWDVAGNEANFFVRDVTGGSRLSFRIRPGAPTSSLDIAASGNVGVGTASPSAPLHVRRSDGTAQLLVEEAIGSVATRSLLTLSNNGGSGFTMTNTNSGQQWRLDSGGADFNITLLGTGELAELDTAGNLEIQGTLTEMSDFRAKESFAAVDAAGILERVLELPITTWTYKADQSSSRQIGPMAQDFFAAFGLGDTPLGVSPRNMSGVALAAIQALAKELEGKEDQLNELRSLNSSLSARLSALEAALLDQ